MRQFIAGVPDDLIEAARVDGASELRIVCSGSSRLAVMPAIAALALFAFVYHWNSYLWPLTVLQGNTGGLPDRHLRLDGLLSYNRGAMNTRPRHGRRDTGGAAAAGAVRASCSASSSTSIVGSGVKG